MRCGPPRRWAWPLPIETWPPGRVGLKQTIPELCQPSRQMGTGFLPGSMQWSRARPPGPWSKGPFWRRPTHDEYLECWRAWQRCIGWTDPVIRPLPGRVPPNWAPHRRPC